MLQVLSIISAITAGILTLISIVDIFGVDRHSDCSHWEHAHNATNPTLLNKHTNITQTHHEPVDCCSNNEHDMEGCDSNDWGLDTLIHLPIGLAMLACSIISASLTCMTKEEPDEGVVWSQQPGKYSGKIFFKFTTNTQVGWYIT